MEQALTVSQNPAAPLAILENGDRAIAATKTVAEIKEMRAQLDGVEEYLKKTGRYDPGIMQRLAELRVKAEQKLGNLLAHTEKNTGGQPKKNQYARRTGSAPTLAQMGIKRNISSLAQKMAALPADKVKEVFQETRAKNRPVTMADVLAKAKPYAAKISNAAKHQDIADKARVITTDIGGPFPLSRCHRHRSSNQNPSLAPPHCRSCKVGWRLCHRHTSSAGDILPLRLAEQPVGLVRHSAQPRDIGLGILPVYADHRIVARLANEPRELAPRYFVNTHREGVRDGDPALAIPQTRRITS